MVCETREEGFFHKFITKVLTLVFIFVSVGMFGAAKKCGLAEGNILVSDLYPPMKWAVISKSINIIQVQINGWKIEAMDNYQVHLCLCWPFFDNLKFSSQSLN